MENQPIEQTTSQATEQTIGQTAGQGSSASVWYVVGAIVVVALVASYFVMKSPSATEVPSDSQALTEQTETPALTAGNTTSDISADLIQTTDASAGLDADASASASDLNSL